MYKIQNTVQKKYKYEWGLNWAKIDNFFQRNVE